MSFLSSQFFFSAMKEFDLIFVNRHHMGHQPSGRGESGPVPFTFLQFPFIPYFAKLTPDLRGAETPRLSPARCMVRDSWFQDNNR